MCGVVVGEVGPQLKIKLPVFKKKKCSYLCNNSKWRPPTHTLAHGLGHMISVYMCMYVLCTCIDAHSDYTLVRSVCFSVSANSRRGRSF